MGLFKLLNFSSDKLLNKEEWNLIYEMYLDWLKNIPSFSEGNYKVINRLYELGLIRKLKLKRKRKQQIVLTEEGKVFGIISCRIKGDFKNNKVILNVSYW